MRAVALASALLAAALLAACGGGAHHRATATSHPTEHSPPPAASAIPPLLDPRDVYAADRPGALSPTVRGFPARVYVPNSESGSVTVIDQRTRKVIGQFPTGALPQHVTPSYDLKTLWVDNDDGNSLTPIDPRSGRPGHPVAVADPYNLY